MEALLIEAFGRALRKLRLAKELTQEQLGFLANLQRKHISSLELGTKQPSLSTVFALAKGLKVNAAYLVSCVEAELNPVPTDDDDRQGAHGPN